MRQLVIERLARSADETAALGESLAKALLVLRAPRGAQPLQSTAASKRDSSADPQNGESLSSLFPLVVYLSGDLGSGKTTFAQGFIRGCGVADPVRSPTYALLEPYEAHELLLLHLDLYRLRDASELETIGLRDWMTPRAVALIEWPEKGRGRLPPPDVRVELSVADAGHLIRITGTSAAGGPWLEILRTT